MNRKPVCLLYSSDGFDEGERINVGLMYTRLGFRVHHAFRGRMAPCNLLVVLRGTAIPNVALPKGTPVHIFNYVGYDMSAVVKGVREYPHILIAPSSTVLKAHDVGLERGIEAFPPVYPELWRFPQYNEGSGGRRFQLVHIGNRKISPDAREDELCRAFEDFLYSSEIHVWGKGWDPARLRHRYHGPVPIREVPQIYAQTHCALGIMYPLQRSAGLFSGRFWLAPLNGAILFSEDGRWPGKMPGVYACDYVRKRVSLEDSPSRSSIVRQADLFWRQQTALVEHHVSMALRKQPPSAVHVPAIGVADVMWSLSRRPMLKVLVEAVRGCRDFLGARFSPEL